MDEDRVSGPGWHLSRGGKQYGPIAHDELLRRAELGEVGPDDLLWKRGFGSWIAATSIPGLLGPPVTPSEQGKPPSPRQRRGWGIALSGGVIAGVVAGVVFWMLSSWMPVSQALHPDQKALLESLTRLHEATSQGISFNSFSQLLLDAKTKFNIARPHLRESSAAQITIALQSEHKVLEIWSAKNDGVFELLCPKQCDDILPIMLDLGIIKDRTEYHSYFENVENFKDNPGSHSRLVSDALTAAGMRLSSAMSSLQ